jgi:hypothetical protein
MVANCSHDLKFWEYLFKWRPSSRPNTGLFCLFDALRYSSTSNRLLAHHYTWGRQILHFLKYLFATCSPQLEFWEYLFKWRPSSSPNTVLFCLLMHCIAMLPLIAMDYWRITIPVDVKFYISWSTYSPFVPTVWNFGNIFSFDFPALA